MDISLAIRTFVAVFVLADALGNVPVFLALTQGMDPAQRNGVINRAALVATAVLVGFTFLGQPILTYLHISTASLEVAGGLGQTHTKVHISISTNFGRFIANGLINQSLLRKRLTALALCKSGLCYS